LKGSTRTAWEGRLSGGDQALSQRRIDWGPRWVPERAVFVPSQGVPPIAMSTSAAASSSGERQSGSFRNDWMPT